MSPVVPTDRSCASMAPTPTFDPPGPCHPVAHHVTPRESWVCTDEHRPAGGATAPRVLLFWQLELRVLVYQVSQSVTSHSSVGNQ